MMRHLSIHNHVMKTMGLTVILVSFTFGTNVLAGSSNAPVDGVWLWQGKAKGLISLSESNSGIEGRKVTDSRRRSAKDSGRVVLKLRRSGTKFKGSVWLSNQKWYQKRCNAPPAAWYDIELSLSAKKNRLVGTWKNRVFSRISCKQTRTRSRRFLLKGRLERTSEPVSIGIGRCEEGTNGERGFEPAANLRQGDQFCVRMVFRRPITNSHPKVTVQTSKTAWDLSLKRPRFPTGETHDTVTFVSRALELVPDGQQTRKIGVYSAAQDNIKARFSGQTKTLTTIASVENNTPAVENETTEAKEEPQSPKPGNESRSDDTVEAESIPADGNANDAKLGRNETLEAPSNDTSTTTPSASDDALTITTVSFDASASQPSARFVRYHENKRRHVADAKQRLRNAVKQFNRASARLERLFKAGQTGTFEWKNALDEFLVLQARAIPSLEAAVVEAESKRYDAYLYSNWALPAVPVLSAKLRGLNESQHKEYYHRVVWGPTKALEFFDTAIEMAASERAKAAQLSDAAFSAVAQRNVARAFDPRHGSPLLGRGWNAPAYATGEVGAPRVIAALSPYIRATLMTDHDTSRFIQLYGQRFLTKLGVINPKVPQSSTEAALLVQPVKAQVERLTKVYRRTVAKRGRTTLKKRVELMLHAQRAYLEADRVYRTLKGARDAVVKAYLADSGLSETVTIAPVEITAEGVVLDLVLNQTSAVPMGAKVRLGTTTLQPQYHGAVISYGISTDVLRRLAKANPKGVPLKITLKPLP